MAKSIASVGFELASDHIDSITLQSRVSLIDWDIVLYRPDISGFIFYAQSGTYQGKRSLDEDTSFRLRETCEHWRRELKEAVDAEKTVVVFLSRLEEVYIATGEKRYSGTGRNRQTTRIVTEFSNYQSLPIIDQPTSRSGSAARIIAKNAILAPYWTEFRDHSEFHVTFAKGTKNACLVIRDGEIPVGLVFEGNKGGALVLVPDLCFDSDEFIGEEEREDEEDGERHYTETAKRFAGSLLAAVVALDSVRAMVESG